jgi:hypothetical protein
MEQIPKPPTTQAEPRQIWQKPRVTQRLKRFWEKRSKPVTICLHLLIVIISQEIYNNRRYQET